MPKVKFSSLVKPVLRRVVNPAALFRAAKLHHHRKANRHLFDDAQLKLFAEVLPSDFLHLGYFDHAEMAGEDITLNELVGAQKRYADLLLDLIDDRSAPVLDVGCGMGGLCRMLIDRGFVPTAVSPDRMQIAHVAKRFPDIRTIRSKFEALPASEHTGQYGTIFTSESLQYLKLDQALPLIGKFLRPGGKWIACDFFFNEASDDRSLHVWKEFVERLPGSGFKLTFQKDITEHILPTLRFLHMWATRFGLPLLDFAKVKLQKKQPGVHYLLGPMFQTLSQLIDNNLEVICPTHFAARKSYRLMTIEHVA